MKKILAIVNTKIAFFLSWILAKEKALISFYKRDPSRSTFFDLFQKVQKEVNFLLNFNEAYQLFMDVRATANIPGDIAEVGPYMGGSSKIICEARDDDRKFYIFDTFKGLPPTDDRWDGNFHTGDFDGTSHTPDLCDFVQRYLQKYPNVYIYKGVFPETSEPIKDKIFSFVHLDVDIYSSTKQSLEFFYPRLSKGGMLISHDYENGPGVRKAFDEFFVDKPETVVQLFAGQQCLVVKQ